MKAELPADTRSVRERRLIRGIVVLLVVVSLVAVDQGLRILAQHKMQRIAAQYCGGVERAGAELTSFPFVPRLVAGQVSSLDFQLFGVRARRVRFTNLGIQLSGVELDRGELLHGRLRVHAIRSGVVKAKTDQTGPLQNSAFELRFKGADATLRGTYRGFVPLDVKGSYRLVNNALVFHISSIEGLALPLNFTYQLPSKGACVGQSTT